MYSTTYILYLQEEEESTQQSRVHTVYPYIVVVVEGRGLQYGQQGCSIEGLGIRHQPAGSWHETNQPDSHIGIQT